MTEITGATRFFGILADPVHHVQTPQGINRLLRQRDRDAVMVPMHVQAADLAPLIAGLRTLRNLEGFVVTVPHKPAMSALCDRLSASAARIGAVNVVRRTADGQLLGDMLDGEGFVAGLRKHGIEPAGLRVYLAGAGGAASAIAFALARAGVRHLTVANRTLPKVHELLDRLAADFPAVTLAVGTRDPSGHDLVVNGTSLGLRPGDDLPLDATLLTPSQTVAEIIMQPADTPLLVAASAMGCRIHYGAPMLLCQIELMVDFMAADPLPQPATPASPRTA